MLAFTSANGTNNLKSHIQSCAKAKGEANVLNQATVHQFYSSSKKINVPARVKSSIAQACVECSALDGRAFETIAGTGLQNLAQALFNAGRLCSTSSKQIKDILPHPTTVREKNLNEFHDFNLSSLDFRLVRMSKESMNSRRHNLFRFVKI